MDIEAKPYEVKLTVFQGPLDLLLHLIEREELDITTVSLAQVTDQYLEYIGLLEELTAEILADFLVVAAKLLLIKSEVLLPRPPRAPDEEEEESVGDELARQLIEYKRFKEAALGLRQREETGLRTYVRVAPPPKLERSLGWGQDRPLDLEDVSLADLIEAVQRAFDVRPPLPSVSEVVAPFTVTVAEKMVLIKERLESHKRVSFNRLLDQATSRVEIIVTLMAVLELIKLGGIVVQQERLFGEIVILLHNTCSEGIARSPSAGSGACPEPAEGIQREQAKRRLGDTSSLLPGEPPNQAQRQKCAQGIEPDIGEGAVATGDEGLVEFV